MFEVLASQSYLYIDYHKKKVRIASSEEPQPYMVAFSQMNAAIEYFNTYQTDQQSLHNLFTGAPVVMDFGIVPGIFDIPIWNGTVSIEVVAVGQTFEQSTDLFTWEVTATLNKNHYDEFLDEI